MPLLESKRAPRKASYAKALARQLVLLLTAGVVAAVLAALSLMNYLQELQIPLLATLAALLAIVALVQLRAGLSLRNQLQDLTAALYRFHPSTDPGIDVVELRLVQGVSGHECLYAKLAVTSPPRTHQLLVVLDGPATAVQASIWNEQEASAAGASYYPKPCKSRMNGAMMAVLELQSDRDPPPLNLVLRIYSSGRDVAITCLEWLPPTRRSTTAPAPRPPSSLASS